ncbi:leucine-rich repeat receptor protein kinase EXS-like [Hibiscus syriacus]|uniref:Leucine-rich repeat receptor protein kinase EXS-like n=1 Tax=Hibiscus syriacus TaxID=106335 RepID=A0A6A2Z4L0_HIBSY|nr:leucine-rich repeat receptor protein kinase EXS-like [Hibiscus syriacus]
MRIVASWFFFILYVAIFFTLAALSVSGECQSDQQEFLLGLKNSLNSSLSVKLVKWNQGTDCCSWDGITCDASGRVIELDLSNQSISGEINNSNSLFRLQHLQQLNLAYNGFLSEFPSGFENLTKLSYLNLSNAGFTGQIPIGISHMTKLVTLDLSQEFLLLTLGRPLLKLEKPNLKTLVQKLTGLKNLYLDDINISANGKEWSQALSSSLPNLQMLSMRRCYLSGPISPSLVKLKSLSIIRLDYNNFSGPFPEFLAVFQNLTSLHLAANNFSGRVPEEILQSPKLQTLDLSFNEFLQGSFQKFPPNASLQSLVVSDTDFGGQLPESIGNLGKLTRIELSNCKFTGPIPKTLEKLTQLVHLDFSSNNFSGPVPSFTSLRNLTELILSGNQLNGSILSTNWSSLLFLERLNLRRNSFSGTVPPTLFQSQSLKVMDLAENQFSGGFNEVKGELSSLLKVIDLSHNGLQGEFPMFLFEIQGLVHLSLSWNKFSGLIQLSAFQKLENLTVLDLSYNNLSIDSSFTNLPLPLLPRFPNVAQLNLASCNLTKFPDFLKNISNFSFLDLSNNRIHGKIPSWIWKTDLQHLNLSLNFFVELDRPSHINPYTTVLDLHGNLLQGEKPFFPPYASYLDYSNNNFRCVIPPEIGDFLQTAVFFSLSGNYFHGRIPESICNIPSLVALDLSNNSLSGSIPQCLMTQMREHFGVLNLKQNYLSGIIPDTFPENCLLQTLDLNQNRLVGKIPKSLAKCRMLEVLDLGKNRINDTFPCHLKSTSKLRVLVLRSNSFRGDVYCRGNNVTWPMLQIIDLASNSFSGKLPQELLMTWNSMKANKNEPYSEYVRHEILKLSDFYFQDSVAVTMKGRELELVKILTSFTSIDLSSKKFEGHVSEAIGDFKALYLLNLSNNALTGPVQSFLGNLPKLEALDLSSNNLTDTCITRFTSKEEVITLPNDPLVQALEKKIRTAADLRRLFEWDPDLIWSTCLLEIQPSVSYLSNGS